MTSVGRRPTLNELLEALYAVIGVEADAGAIDPNAETFRVVLTFQRSQCPQDWREGQPKPTWLFEQIREELREWLRQRAREELWVSKEEQFGASIDTLMAYWMEELKVNAALPENMLTRAKKQILSNTILRLKELKERREAGGVSSSTESRREKARKAWMEDEYEAPRREEEQRRRQQQRDWQDETFVYGFDSAPGVGKGSAGGSAADMDEEIRRKAEEFFRQQHRRAWDDIFSSDFYGRQQRPQDPLKPQSGNKLPWYKILGVPADATKEQIKKAHRSLVKLYQPRTSADAEDKEKTARMAEINTARDEGLGGL
jgi:DnaJ domain